MLSLILARHEKLLDGAVPADVAKRTGRRSFAPLLWLFWRLLIMVLHAGLVQVHVCAASNVSSTGGARVVAARASARGDDVGGGGGGGGGSGFGFGAVLVLRLPAGRVIPGMVVWS